METREHWDKVYRSRPPDQVSWFQTHAALSLQFIRSTGVARDAAIIDVGGGASTLVDDLLDAGYANLTVLDISPAALQAARRRLGERAAKVRWIAADATRPPLPRHGFDLWHDRAVFHFLTGPEDRQRYVETVLHAVKPGGHVIVATFGPQGPAECSGLPVMRYDAEGLHGEFGAPFTLVDHAEELHRTPAGTVQQFMFCYCRAAR